jgi:hypothetical protein
MTVREKCFKPLYGFCTCLDEGLAKDDCGIGLPSKYRAKLIKELNTQYYTYLVIYDGFCHEVVRVGVLANNLFIDRGVDCTEAQSWDCGDAIKFDWTMSGIKELSDGLQKEEDEKEDCEETFTGSIKNGNCTVHFKDGVAIKETPNKVQIQDGCYDRPMPTYKDGCLVDLRNGMKPQNYQATCEKRTCERCQ